MAANEYCPQCGEEAHRHPKWDCDFNFVFGKWQPMTKTDHKWLEEVGEW